jgi:hypothetical protein
VRDGDISPAGGESREHCSAIPDELASSSTRTRRSAGFAGERSNRRLGVRKFRDERLESLQVILRLLHRSACHERGIRHRSRQIRLQV